MLLWKKNSNKENNDKTEVNNKSNEKIVLYFLLEREINRIYEYAKKLGITIKKCFTDIEEAKVEFIMENRDAHIVIIESGQGKFINTNNRKELIDLLSICDGTSKKITVFYVNSVIKAETLKKIGRKNKDIQWIKYINTARAIKDIAKLGEHYYQETDYDEDTEDKILDNSLNFIGKSVNVDDTIERKAVYNILDELAQAKHSEQLDKFNVVI